MPRFLLLKKQNCVELSMSMFILQLPGLALAPYYEMKEGVLHSRTNRFLAFLTFWTYLKIIDIDPHAEVIQIYRRVLWFFVFSKRILFSEIKRIDYSYADFITSWTLLSEAADSIDLFTVSIVLREDMKKIKLWTFFGEGSGVSGVVGDGWINFEGFQEDDSRNFVEVLQYLTQKPLV